MKKFVSALLAYSLMLQSLFSCCSCTSFYPSGNSLNLKEYQNYQKDIIIILNGNRVLKVPPGKLFLIDNQSEITFGVGVINNFSNKLSAPYAGIINPEAVDSSRTVESDSKPYLFYWLKDKTRLTIQQGSFFHWVPDSSGYFWLAYDKDDKKLYKFYADEVISISVEEINWVATSVLIGGLIIITALLISAATFSGMDNLFEGTRW